MIYLLISTKVNHYLDSINCKLETNKQFLGFLNSIFADYGIKLKLKKKYKHIKIDKKRKTICYINYNLIYVNNMNNFI